MLSSSTLQTPSRQRLHRPSFGLQPNSAEKPLNLSVNGAISRKPSTPGLGGSDPRTPMPSMEADFDVGDLVNVPGDMHGIVRFLGAVAGKNGRFVGVELSREYANRGKNDGDVDGVSYFTTTIPGSGIFLPVHRAEKRYSSGTSIDSPATPDTPSYAAMKPRAVKGLTPPGAAMTSKFSQSIGPGARPSSPQFKAKRPSLPRPESPLRRQAPVLAPTPGKSLSQSTRAGSRPLLSATTPSKTNLRASTSQKPPQPVRPYSRTGSRHGHRDEDGVASLGTTSNSRNSGVSSVPLFSHSVRPSSRLGSSGEQEAELQRIRAELADRDKRLDEQAASLAEMEHSIKELSSLLPTDSGPLDGEEQTNAQLRQMLREKNEKISILTAEFDNHRADFRSTLDSLEMASTETERVYEEQKRDLLAQLAEYQEMGSSKEDFEAVAQQLRQLEELVAELEEGLEESRRGEAEARSEVEFLRGEVERGRSELKREREKAAASVKDPARGEAASSREIEQRDDEIRGLKAIIHSLSSNPDAANKGRDFLAKSDEVDRLRTDLQAVQSEKEALERQVEQLRRDRNVPNGASHVRTESERTATAPDSLTVMPLRSRADTTRHAPGEANWRAHGKSDRLNAPLLTHAINDANPRDGAYCEMCDAPGHDTLDCKHLQASDTTASDHGATAEPSRFVSSEDPSVAKQEPLRINKPTKKAADEDAWCALCEKDGHLAFDCPQEQY